MQINKILMILLVILTIGACKKDELKYEKSLLEGKWKWIGATRYVTFQSSVIDISFINANIFNDEYGVEFDRKGHVTYQINSKEVCSYRIVFERFDEVFIPPDKNFSFLILLNNRMQNQLEGRINADSLFTNPSHMPLKNVRGQNVDTIYSYIFLHNN